MAKGSLRVKLGDQTVTGQSIGLVGLSGDTEFPHLHFTVRHRGKIVDPFAYDALPNTCGGGHPIWVDSIHEQTEYRAREILNYGFSDLVPTMDLIESGEVARRPITAGSQALVAYVRAIGLQAGDQQILTVQVPTALPFSEYRPQALDHDKGSILHFRRKKAERSNMANRNLCGILSRRKRWVRKY
jgi:hypothetical protein